MSAQYSVAEQSMTGYWQSAHKCQEEIKRAPENVKIQYCGALSPDQVGSTFAKYHCFLFPTVSENYGHVIVEALSNCCPVVLSKGTTPWDDLNNRGGYTCELMDVEQYATRLKQIQNMGQEDYNCLMRETALYYNEKMMSDDSISGHIEMLTKAMQQAR